MVRRRKKYDYSNNYRRRKLIFWGVLLLAFIVAALLLLMPHLQYKDPAAQTVRAGICGAVKTPAVYNVPKGADLAMLIRRAGGLTTRADIRNVDLDVIVQHDSIYHIPARVRRPDDPDDPLARISPWDFERLLAMPPVDVDLPPEFPDIEQLNILYVGTPHVFIIINYYPSLRLANLMHVPYTTVFWGNEIRLMDIFFTMGIETTASVLANRFQMKIDHYMIQERFSFIEMIDLLNGVRVNIDEQFAESYNLEPGPARINGFLAGEFIRFRGPYFFESYTLRRSAYETPATRKTALEMRHHRQRLVMTGMQNAFNQMGTTEQLTKMNQLRRTIESDLTIGRIQDMFQALRQTPRLQYGTIPGYYAEDREYFYPDIPSLNQLKNQMIRDQLAIRNN